MVVELNASTRVPLAVKLVTDVTPKVDIPVTFKSLDVVPTETHKVPTVETPVTFNVVVVEPAP